jgi:hypothetical protein
MNMELDDIKTAWQALDRRLEEQNTVNLRVFRDGKLKDARRALRPLEWGQRAQIAAGLCLMLLVTPFWMAHRSTLHLLLPGLMMHAYGLMFVLFAARTLYLIGRVDYAEPVLRLQRRLAELRVWRARVEQPLFGMAGCFIWIPLTLVIFEALGADLWARTPEVVYWFIASGFVCLGVFYGVVRWMRQSRSERVRAAIENSFVGNSIRRAQEELDEVARFEQA